MRTADSHESKIIELIELQQPDGSKAIQVGSRIAVLAEPGDDLSSLEMPAEESVSAEPSAAQQSEAKPEQKETSTPSKPTEKPAPTKNPKQKYPLYPSVAVLLHRHKLSADQIKATGPNGRLLKGDVLAHVKEISSSYPQELSSRLDKRSHLDLSNIKPAPPSSSKAGQGAAAQKAAEQAAEPAPTEQPRLLAMPISLASVLSVQRRMQESLGVTLPLSTFISRAVDLANDGLPAREDPPTADELFDAVVGVSTAGGKLSRGHFIPQVAALPSTNGLGLAPRRQASSRRDLFDEIVGSRSGASMAASRSMSSVSGSLGAAGAENLFSLSVDRAEEKRAKLFLERVKAVLEVDPGRLVL